MRKIYLFATFTLVSVIAISQEFSGFRSGNYAGVNGVFGNPASIVDTRYRWDVNLLSFSSSIGNNKASFSLSDLTSSFDSDKLTDQLFSATGGLSSALGNVDFRGPSVMFNTGNKMSVALTSRARAMVNIIDFDAALGKQLVDDANNNIQFPYTISSNSNMQFKVNAWTEFGISAARIITDNNQHFLKGGITLKYLAGAGNGYINLSQMNGTLNQDLFGDVYLSNSKGSRISTGFGGIELSESLESNDFMKFDNSGFGGEIGFVYEYRPDYEQYKSAGKPANAQNKYKYKIGLALLDVGTVKYDKDMQRSGTYTTDITGNERFYLSELNDVDSFNSVFKSRPQYFTPAASNAATSYSVSLPSTLQLDVDYHIKKGLYASFAAQLPLTSSSEYNPINYTAITLTPRFEGKQFGVYLPLNYNSLTDFNAGVSLRLGPVFIGSGSIISAMIGNSKQVDVHIGFRVAGLN